MVVVQERPTFRGGDSTVLVFLGGMMAWHVTPLEEVKDTGSEGCDELIVLDYALLIFFKRNIFKY